MDLVGGMLSVKTSKTEADVEIPLFPPLRRVLEGRKHNRSGFVFPEAARVLEKSPDSLTWEFKKIVARAFETKTKPSTEPERRMQRSEVREEAMAAVARLPESKKRDRMLDACDRYCSGQSFQDIVKATGGSKGTLSADLHEVQKLIGKTFLAEEKPSIKDAVERVTCVSQKGRKRAASIRDWHALRTTFVTLALSANVPLELVRRVTGHTTVEVVLKHYFRPNREQFKAALVGAMPAVLSGVEPETLVPKDELAALAGKFAAGTATAEDKARLHALTAN